LSKREKKNPCSSFLLSLSWQRRLKARRKKNPAKKKTLTWFRRKRRKERRREARKCVLDVREVMFDEATYRVL
jgi:hypothetical protein